MPWDSSKKCSSVTLSNSDRTATLTPPVDLWGQAWGTQGRSSGKYYFEVEIDSACSFYEGAGITKESSISDYCTSWPDQSKLICCLVSGEIYDENSYIGDLGEWENDGDTLMVAVDLDNGKLWFGVNGTWYNSGDPAAGTNQSATFSTGSTWYPWCRQYGCGGE